VSEGPIHASDVRALPGPRRVDRVRRALRQDGVDLEVVEHDLDGWIALFRGDSQPALRVLILELLEGVDDPRADALAERALRDRGDGVRLEALHRLLYRFPERAEELARAHLHDDGVEVRLLAAARLHAIDPETTIDALFEGVRTEIDGPREDHVLERTVEFLVDDVGDRTVVPRLRALADEVDDPEGMIAWALDALGGPA